MKRDPLPETELLDAVRSLPGWAFTDGKLVRSYRFASFAEAIAFVTKVAELSEQARHHPDIDVRYQVVRLALWTHDAGAVTRMDISLAAEISRRFGP